MQYFLGCIKKKIFFIDGLINISAAQIFLFLQKIISDKKDFELKYPDTANINIGSMVQPLNYEDACFCNVA